MFLEVGARLYVHAEYGVPGKSYGLWRHDDTLGAKHAENAYNTRYQTNDHGFRNREAVTRPKPAGALRIIAYGGSTTFCYNLDYAETWPVQLERLLQAHHNSKDQVLNAGAIAWSLGHAFTRALTDIPELKPDAVILYSGINEDLNARSLAAEGVSMAALAAAGEYGRFATNLDQNRWLMRNLVALKTLDHWMAPWTQRAGLLMAPPVADEDAPAVPVPAILENYLRTLESFLDFAHEQGVQTLFVVQTHGRNNRMNAYLTSYSRAGARVARERGAQVVDAEVLFSSHKGDAMDLFAPSGVHYSALGARELAQLIYDEAFNAEQ